MDEVEKNKTVEKDMKKLVNKSWFRYWLSAEMSNSYERLQSLSFCYSIIPVLKKLYPNKEEFGEAVKRHLNFFNTEPTWGSPILGIAIAMEEEKAKTSTNKLTQKPDKLPVRMESMRHEIEFRQSNRSADFIQGIEEEESDDRFIHRGRMLHTLFSAIETAEDIDPAIERLIFEGVIASSEKAEEIREVARKAFSSPEIQDWYSGEWTLFNECAIIYKEKGVLQTRRPDRVMMKDGQVVVVDFKFGKENLQYNKQVKGYMQLLTKMGYKNITGYLWYVDEELIVKVK